MADVLLAALVDDVATIGRVLVVNAGAPVPSCPGWTVADLVRHHGAVLRWAAEIVRTGGAAGDGHRGPDDVDELANWYAEGAARLVDVLRRTDPQRDCWTFGRPPAKAWFWTRRQALEAAIHRWDAQQAAGVADGFPDEVAAAGISEVVDDLFPRRVALGRCAPCRARSNSWRRTSTARGRSAATPQGLRGMPGSTGRPVRCSCCCGGAPTSTTPRCPSHCHRTCLASSPSRDSLRDDGRDVMAAALVHRYLAALAGRPDRLGGCRR